MSGILKGCSINLLKNETLAPVNALTSIDFDNDIKRSTTSENPFADAI